ncbi:MAG: DUF2807 domain-containing protein [Spirochaetaceae bacterium]|nr:MAG: DUF2807 domain-containing protein [Spirochaetaceae bacterium]
MELTEEREVSHFNKVDFRGLGRLVISQGEKQSVKLTASEVVLPHLRTEVKGGVLIVSLRWWPGMFFRIAEMKTLEVQLIVEKLASLKVSGAGFVESREKIQVNDMGIHLSGAGEIRLELQGHRIGTRLTGAGRIVLWGEADEQEIQLTGAGSVQAENLVTRRVQVHSSGAGECRVHATETLDAKLSGAGSIRYRGNPQIQSRMTGLGTLASMD